MKAINIYALTRTSKSGYMRRFDRQMSERDYYLPVKEWEVEGLRRLGNCLCKEENDFDKLFFFYSFQIPKLGKEFDLLQIGADTVLNIELKSQPVSDEKIRRQLLLNKQYLNTLGKSVYSFTFISETNRLVRLSNSERLRESSWEELRELLIPGDKCLLQDIEAEFGEDRFLLSPINQPDRFLRRDYFLTSQQRDIRNKIIRNIEEAKSSDRFPCQGFTGLPGTGKTLLLFDLALHFSERDRVGILHFGSYSRELQKLDTLLKRIDFIYCRGEEDILPKLEGLALLCIDEGNRMSREFWEKLADYAAAHKLPIIVSYDDQSPVSQWERTNNTDRLLGEIPGFVGYSLTNRIRTNPGLSTFIKNLVHSGKNMYRRDNKGIQLYYANTTAEAETMLKSLTKKGYDYIKAYPGESAVPGISFEEAYYGEYDKVAMLAGPELYYDEKGYLREQTTDGNRYFAVSKLFHGLNRARKGLALVVLDNEAIFEKAITILQGEEK